MAQSNTEMSSFAKNIFLAKYSHTKSDGTKETWNEVAERVVNAVVPEQMVLLRSNMKMYISQRKFIPGGRYLFASGRPYHQINNCFLYRAEDSREGWSDLLRKTSLSLMTGGGVGIDYSAVRPEGEPIAKIGGLASGPISLMQMINEVGRHVMQGGSRRSAIWAGLDWKHADIFKFINLKNWSEEVKSLKAKDFNFPATMDMTNISVILDKNFFDILNNEKQVPGYQFNWASDVYHTVCQQMFSTSEPGFSVNYFDSKESLRNACTEITSSDDSDVCNLGSINLARVSDSNEFGRIVDDCTWFLLFGGYYSDVPHPEVRFCRDKNRRIGLGLMGIHEWLLKRKYKYEPNKELEQWLKIYEERSRHSANWFARSVDSNCIPIKLRAIAPTGTIGIIAETTTGIEPIFCNAFKRRYLKGKEWVYEYVLDPTAKRLIEEYGTKDTDIEDAHSMSGNLEGFERRIEFQAFVQRYTDHGISSTINIARWGSESNNQLNVGARSSILYKYLTQLRGITCYAEGSRGGQPLTPVKYSEVANQLGKVFVEQQDICDITGAGSCGV